MPPSIANLSPSPPPPQAQPLWRNRTSRPNVSARTAQRLCDLAAIATAVAFAVPVGEIGAPTRRSSDVALARQSAMYLAHIAFGLTYSEIGRAFERDRTT